MTHYISLPRVLLFLGCLAFDDKLIVLRMIGQVFCRLFLSWNLSGVFLMISLGGVFSGERQRRQNAVQVPYQEYTLSKCLSTADVKLDHLVGDIVCQEYPL